MVSRGGIGGARRAEWFLKYVLAGDDIGRARQALEAEPYLATAKWRASAFRVAGIASFMAGNEDEEQDGTSLHLACCCGSLKVAALLLKVGSDPNVRNCSGRRPLCFAAHHGHLEVVRLLLESAANPNSGSSLRRQPPLVSAADLDGSWSEDFALGYAELLVKHGADVNQTARLEMSVEIAKDGKVTVSFKHTGTKETALHCAARHGQGRMVKLLISQAADINAQGLEHGATALHLVLSRRSSVSNCFAELTETADIVELLVESGADTNAKDRHGQTPLDLAEKNDDMEALALMS
jgi:ankyrin repeat protein